MTKKEAKTLDELFHDTLKDIYFAEKKILATLPKMEKAAQASQLKMAFAKHKTETEGHVRGSRRSSRPSTRSRKARLVMRSSASPTKVQRL
jgi:hypothetical protein